MHLFTGIMNCKKKHVQVLQYLPSIKEQMLSVETVTPLRVKHKIMNTKVDFNQSICNSFSSVFHILCSSNLLIVCLSMCPLSCKLRFTAYLHGNWLLWTPTISGTSWFQCHHKHHLKSKAVRSRYSVDCTLTSFPCSPPVDIHKQDIASECQCVQITSLVTPHVLLGNYTIKWRRSDTCSRVSTHQCSLTVYA